MPFGPLSLYHCTRFRSSTCAAGRRSPLRLKPESSSAAVHMVPFSALSSQSLMYDDSFHHAASRLAAQFFFMRSLFHHAWDLYHSSRAASSDSVAS